VEVGALSDIGGRLNLRFTKATALWGQSCIRVVLFQTICKDKHMDFLNQQSETGSAVSQEKRKAAKPRRPKLKKEEKRLKRPLSKRSGGPKSPEGKSNSAQNSTKHGGYVVPSRVSEEFCRFEQEVYVRLEPIGAIEVELVSEIAFTLWRSKLIQRYVNNALDAAEFDDVGLRQLAHLTGFPFEERYQYLLNVNEIDETRLQRFAKFWSTSCDGLIELGGVDAVIAAGDVRIREIHEEGAKVLGQRVVHQVMYEKFFDALDRVMHEARDGRNSLGIKLLGLQDFTELINYWIYRNCLKISAARHKMREQEALRILCDPNIERAQSRADQTLQRQLNTYWLMKNTEMKTGRDLNPTIPKQTTSHVTLLN